MGLFQAAQRGTLFLDDINDLPAHLRHFEAKIILLCVRWYLRFGLSFRNLEEMMAEHNLSVDHVTIWRWVQRYAPELNRRCRPEVRTSLASFEEPGLPYVLLQEHSNDR